MPDAFSMPVRRSDTSDARCTTPLWTTSPTKRTPSISAISDGGANTSVPPSANVTLASSVVASSSHGTVIDSRTAWRRCTAGSCREGRVVIGATGSPMMRS